METVPGAGSGVRHALCRDGSRLRPCLKRRRQRDAMSRALWHATGLCAHDGYCERPAWRSAGGKGEGWLSAGGRHGRLAGRACQALAPAFRVTEGTRWVTRRVGYIRTGVRCLGRTSSCRCSCPVGGAGRLRADGLRFNNSSTIRRHAAATTRCNLLCPLRTPHWHPRVHQAGRT